MPFTAAWGMAMGMGNESVMPSIQRSTMAWYIHKGCIQEGMLMRRLCGEVISIEYQDSNYDKYNIT